MTLLIMKISVSTILMISGGILSLIGAYVASIESSNDKDELIKQDKEIIALTKENSRLSKEALNQITGGDSWGYLVSGLHTIKGIPNQSFGFSFNLVGELPLYDVTINIYDIEFNNNQPTKSQTLKTIFSKEVGTLTKSLYSDILGILNLPNKERVDYLMKLRARNGEITQHWIFMKKKDNYWAVATKVYRFRSNHNGGFSKENLMEKIDDDFPIKNIEWIEY